MVSTRAYNPDVAVELRDYASTSVPATAAGNPVVESLRAGAERFLAIARAAAPSLSRQ